MSDDTLADYLVRHYGSLKRRITQLLGNGDLAADVLHDAWLRVQSKNDAGPVVSPGSYLVRVAVNIAVDLQRRQSRSLSLDEVDALMALSDTAPGPAETVEFRSELGAMQKYIDRLPGRRRTILLMVRVQGLQQKEVASLLGVSLRVVENELKRAHDYLDEQMKKQNNC